MDLFIEGRKNQFQKLEKAISAEDQLIWIHAASLGEYEQAVPVIKSLKQRFPRKKVLISVFSPSAYEVKKNNHIADFITYLPLDTAANVRHFLDLVQPEWALFIKYEFWPNFLKELHKRQIKTLLVSGVFRKNQLFFKPHGRWMRSYLQAFDHFFVQNKISEELLLSIGFKNISISGDTRFDRVSQQLRQDNTLDFIVEFKNKHLCIVAGSTWPEDEELLLHFINSSSEEIKFIIAPHEIAAERIRRLKHNLKPKNVLYSEKEGQDLRDFQVFIIDNVGLLSRIYSYADIAYVGGAAGNTGLHNILEPATFGVPIVIGSKFSKFSEAIELERLAGLYSVGSKEEVTAILSKLLQNKIFREQTGRIAGHYIDKNTGATEIILEYMLERKQALHQEK